MYCEQDDTPILFLTCLIFILSGLLGWFIFKKSQPCECPEQVIVVNSKTFKDDLENPLPVGDIFKKMFEEQSVIGIKL